METTETAIDLKYIAYILQKYLKMLIALPVTAALITGVISFVFMMPIYQANANILVNRPANEVTSSVNPNDITAYQKLVSTYAEMAKLDLVYLEAGKQIGLDEGTTKALASTIRVSPKGETQILTISVQSENPELAQQYVGALAQALKVTGAEKIGQDNIQLLDAPALPKSPVAPNKVMNVATAFVLGAVIAGLIALLVEYLDTRVKRPEQIERITKLLILGMIPAFEEEGGEMVVEVINNSKSIASEAYRALRTKIQFSNFDDDQQVIAVTSATRAEGKTTTMANLAAAFAQAGKKTLIIDADMRKPTLHKQFDLGEMHGLSSVLVGVESFENCVQHSKDQENLDILVCGPIPSNPSEMLGSQKMADFIVQMRKQYDFILLDAPPVLAVTDAEILAKLADSITLIARHNHVKEDQLAEAAKRLKDVEAHVLGVVMNYIEKDGYYYYYYQN